MAATAANTGRDTRHLLWFAIPLAIGGSLAAALITGHDAMTASAARTLAVIGGVVTVGLCALPWLLRGEHIQRQRAAQREIRRWRMIAVSSAGWCGATLAFAAADAAELAGVSVAQLDIGDFQTYVTHVVAGRIVVLVLVCTALLTLVGAVLSHGRIPDPAQWTMPAAAIALLGLVAMPLAGHASHEALTALLITGHTAAAGLWCGLLCGQALLLRSRTEWSVSLPAFSRWALVFVATVGVSGIASTLLLSTPAELVTSGYGRIILAKAGLLAVLLSLGYLWRRVWVADARRHRGDTAVSVRRAAIEVAMMAVAFGLAATLASSA
ncbi:CopD family protein [Hoyosella sp. YIM 151337]|uniref:copper resistance D family protein n=1 Tax=Hoyosella sp. YIM 151337 TaxID=2992742 RepID=UPI00223686AC|nr:CopD family protein [Hoyosella sp. YIM 151337]MCW4354748.1 CopD family protein [Hoyosella sp. YIM 151337]